MYTLYTSGASHLTFCPTLYIMYILYTEWRNSLDTKGNMLNIDWRVTFASPCIKYVHYIQVARVT
jgi:hypothetical protein